MKTTLHRIRMISRLILGVLIATQVYAAPFKKGSVAVLQATASANNTTASIVEVSSTSTTPSTPLQTIAIDGTTLPNALRFSGSATSTGYLSSSADRNLLTFTGHNSITTGVNANTLTARAVATVDGSGTLALASTYTGSSGNQTRSATSLNNSNWFIADQGGIYTNSSSSASPSGNVRSIKTFGGTVYTLQASGTLTNIAVNTISASSGGTITGLPGLTNKSAAQDFYLISSGATPGVFDVLYLLTATTNTAGIIEKYSLVAGTWTANGSYTTTFGGFGLAAADNGDGALLYVSSGLGALTANSLIKLADTAGYNATISITTGNNVTLYTAPAGNIIKGVEFAPFAPFPDLSTYVRVGRYDLPEPTRTALPPGTASHNLLCQEASAVTYNWDTDTLFISCDGGRSITQVSKSGVLIDTMSLDLQSGAPQGTAFYDPEGITYVGNGQFVISEERDRQLVKFTYAAGTTLTRAAAQTVDLGTFDDNTGTEGLSWDPQTNGFIVLKEKSPIGLFQTAVDFVNGTATNGSPSTVNSTNLFDTSLLGMTDVADVFTLSNIPSLAIHPLAGNMLVLGQENARVVNVSRTGVIHSTLQITSDPGNPLNAADQQHEGITMDRDGIIYIVNENGGGSIDYPQLWVYAPSAVPNAAPTAVALFNTTTSIVENSSTASPIKMGDIVVTDDGLGTNALSLTGADAASFEITSGSLFLKSGTVLDFETKTSFAVTINADDTTLGATPDVTVNFNLTVTDQEPEASATPALAITEVSPWSSTAANSPIAADWFEVTNISDNTVSITGWKVDDSSAAFGTAVALNGITSIAPGESVIFVEGDAAKATAFTANWFDVSPPVGLQVGYYSGSGIGLSTDGDGVNLFNAAGLVQASVSFGVADSSAPRQTFDNTLALNSVTLTVLSSVGVNGGFVAANSANEIGSPGYSAPGVLRITEVAPWSSGNSPVQQDWFEVTNIGARAVNITGWKMDDGSESYATAVPITGISSIAPGESVILIETNDLATKAALFRSNWFGASPPVGLQIGAYSGGGVGLSTGGDGVNLYDSKSPIAVRRASVNFGIAPSSAPFATFDNTAAADVATISLKSVPGVNAAFIAINSANEVGSPGTITSGGPTDFAAWLAANGFASFGLGADTDNDGIRDSLEYFFNMNPSAGGNFGNMPKLQPNNGALELAFTRLTDTGSVLGELQVSSDLHSWTPGLLDVDYAISSAIVTDDETAFTYALPGSGPSDPGTSPVYLTPNLSDPVGASLGGVRVVNEGLVGVGRLSGDNTDSFGETQGAASGLFITNWRLDAGLLKGTFNVLPDRGHGDGTSNYAARLHRVDFTFTPYYGVGPVAQGQVSPSYVDTTKFTYQDGPITKFTTGLNPIPTGNITLFGQTVGTATAANGPGGSQQSLLSFDAEAVHLFEDGSGFVSDEYGTYIARFDATKKITGLTQLPGAAQPIKSNALNFDSVAAPTTGRRNNQGLEGMSVTPDGTRLFAMLQSATVQDTNGSQQQTRNNARLFVYDIVGANRENPVLVGEYVVKLPQIDLNSNGSGADGTAAQSEIVALGNSSFLMLPRDGNGLGKSGSAPILFKSVQLVDFASATNILGMFDGVIPVSPLGVLDSNVKAAATAEIINMLEPTDLAKFGLNTTLPANSNTLNEKIEGMALVPDISTEQANDFFLFVANDNDFQSSNVMMLDAAGTVSTKGNGQVGGVTNDAMFYVYRLIIDASGKKFFRFDVE